MDLKKILFFNIIVLICVLSLIISNKSLIQTKVSILESFTYKNQKVKACIFVLCRERELVQLSTTIQNFEEKFNSKYNYDYVIVNDVEFSDEFKNAISQLTKSKVKFGIVPQEHWSYPPNINQEKARLAREKMVNMSIPKGGSVAYRFMCRYYSGFFFRHPLVLEYDYYLRMEPGVKYTCNINYDPFKYMHDKNYEYGFTILLGEAADTIPTLWNETLKFAKINKDIILRETSNLGFLKSKNGGYNFCQFWSNFEIGSFNFFRSENYLKYFDYLEQTGGFFYERWGDAPVHTLAVSMFLPKSKVLFFEDIGYKHGNYHENCPISPSVLINCSCQTNNNWRGAYCLQRWFNIDA